MAGWVLFKVIGGSWDMGSVALFSAIISILAQLGDLAGSALKRAAGVKDSGWIFPGHGGLLDRTCSLVFAVFFAYYWFR
jgi:phosphatidate cytidylyltransferase